jgi:hypothetical protein
MNQGFFARFTEFSQFDFSRRDAIDTKSGITFMEQNLSTLKVVHDFVFRNICQRSFLQLTENALVFVGTI